MLARQCVRCGGLFHPRPQIPDQAFCSSHACQRARKNLWQQVRLRDDPDYRENQRAAQRGWQARNSDYWRQYRARHKRQVVPADSAKIDVSDGLVDGLYLIRKSSISAPKAGDLWIIEAARSCPACLVKMDV